MLTPGSGVSGASGLIIVALAPGTSAETVRSRSCWSVAVTVAMPRWLATGSPSDPVDVAPGRGEVGERRGGGGSAVRAGSGGPARRDRARRRRRGRGAGRSRLDAVGADLAARGSGRG